MENFDKLFKEIIDILDDTGKKIAEEYHLPEKPKFESEVINDNRDTDSEPREDNYDLGSLDYTTAEEEEEEDILKELFDVKTNNENYEQSNKIEDDEEEEESNENENSIEIEKESDEDENSIEMEKESDEDEEDDDNVVTKYSSDNKLIIQFNYFTRKIKL